MRYFLDNFKGVYASDNPFGRDVTGTPLQRFYSLTHTHIGADFAVPVGTPIYAPADGTMLAVAVSVPKGNVGVFDFTDTHGVEWGIELCHLQKLPQAGKYKEGQIIAHTGATGTACTGPHLHCVAHRDCIVAKHYAAISAAGSIDWQHGRAMFLSLVQQGALRDPYELFTSQLN